MNADSTDSVKPSDDPRLYGVTGAEVLYTDPATVYEAHIEPTVGPPHAPVEIEEWSVHPPEYHLPSADAILDWLYEWVAENGEITEDGDDRWREASQSPAAVLAAEALRSALAAGMKFRMADKHLRSLWVTWDDAGDPLLDGQPMYVGTTDCCCAYGAARSGEWPEFECAACPVHAQRHGPIADKCARHRRLDAVLAARSACSSWPPAEQSAVPERTAGNQPSVKSVGLMNYVHEGCV